MFFKLSAPHVSFREYMYEGNLITMPLVLLIASVVKLFRIPIPGSTDIPPVRSLQPFRGPAERMDPEILAAITDMDQQLHDFGFTRVDLISINDLVNNTRYGGAVYRSGEGDAVAWIRYRLWPNLERRNKFTRLALYSLGPGGEVILTTAATRDVLDPPEWHVEYHPKVAVNRLRDLHQEHVRRVLGPTRPMIADNLESAFNLLEHTHEEFVDYQLQRGVFVETKDQPTNHAPPAVDKEESSHGASPLPQTNDPDEIPEGVSKNAIGPITRDPNLGDVGFGDPIAQESFQEGIVEDAELIVDADRSTSGSLGEATFDDTTYDDLQPIIDEVHRQETKQSGWLSKLVILGVSIAVFIGLGAWQWELELVLILVPILFVHELGHYVAMKVFGYKNIHMFFIPLLGAAVSGRNYRVSGWKKALVSLAGPLPSIALAVVLAGVGLATENEWCLKGAMITLILNVMNLAPFLPLDGGQVAHVTLFSRSIFIDVLFRIGTIIALFGVAALLKAKFLFALGIAMVLGLPTVWRTIRLTERLRKEGLPEPTDDTMPPEAIRAVVDGIQRSNLPTQHTSALAKLTLAIYEAVIIRPPSWPATLGIWTLYFAGLFVGVAGMIVIGVAAVGGGLFDFLPEFEEHYERVAIDDGDFRLAKPDMQTDSGRPDLLAWRFADDASAQAAFEQLKDRNDESVARLGNMVFTSRVTSETEQDDFDDEGFEDVEIQWEINERKASDDPRLSDLQGAVWQRSFIQSQPALIIATEAELADSIQETAESLPYNIGQYAPIAPWTPRIKLTDEQRDLQKRLSVLQGKTSKTPWKVIAQPALDDLDEDTSPQAFRERLKQSAKRAEQTQANRLKWIREQAESTTGSTQRLYQTYADYEVKSRAWREDKRLPQDKGQPPRMDKLLEPLLPELGYLHRDHPLLATGATIEAYEFDPTAEEDSAGEPFPLDTEGRSVTFLQIYATHDIAAAYACIHAWLKQQGIEEVVWTYSKIRLEE